MADVTVEICTIELFGPEELKSLDDETTVVLVGNENNPLQRGPHKAIYRGGYFYIEGRQEREDPGPDYYWSDVFTYNRVFRRAD